MSSYLSYETERREIRIVPVNVIDFKPSVSVNNMGIREYSDSFKVSFINDTDAYQFIRFFEIEQSEITWKYIKHDLFLYYKDLPTHLFHEYQSYSVFLVKKVPTWAVLRSVYRYQGMFLQSLNFFSYQ